MTLFQRLRRRKLFQWAAAYLAGAWLLLQVVDLIGGFFHWPERVGQVATVLLGVGFLAALVLAWYHGEKGRQHVTTIEVVMLTGILLLAGVGMAFVGGDLRERRDEPSGTAAPATVIHAAAAVEQNSIAVLPFVNMSGVAENEYFSDGITEEILNVLARLPDLRVPARTSSFSFKGKNVPVDEIAKRLKVAHVLEGSVRRNGERVRITAQLIDARTDQHLWSETYDRELKDVFAVQDEIARAIVQALQLRMAGTQRASLVGTPTADLEAYELYLKGRYFWNRRRGLDLQKALEFFEQAIERDPTYAQAYAGLAQTYVLLPLFDAMRPAEARARASAAAERALRLDGTLADAHAALGMVYNSDYRWEEAEQAYRRAIELHPANPTAHHWYGSLLGSIGRGEASLAELRRAQELDPLSISIGYSLGFRLLFLRRFDEALRQLQSTVELDPAHPTARYFLGRAHLQRGDKEKAIAELERALANSPDRGTRSVGSLGYAYAVSGRTAEARRLLEELHRRAEREPVAPSALAVLYVGLGEKDEALRWLDRAVEERDRHISVTGLHDPEFDPLRSDPRFRMLLRKMGLER